MIPIIRTIAELKRHIALISGGLAFVPTMGALHEGHLSLLRYANAHYPHTLLSIFVNPTQFGKNEDFDKYPRDLESDVALVAGSGIQLSGVFAPDIQSMYPYEQVPLVSFPFLSNKLCGKSRPGHFDGVSIVLLKLLNLIRPKALVMGQKDYQQTVIVRRLIEEFFIETELVVSPTVREPSGLAMSSRNQYLSTEERSLASELYACLQNLASRLEVGMKYEFIQKLCSEHAKSLSDKGIKMDYLEVLQAQDLEPFQELKSGMQYVVAIAAFVGNTRLIDNILKKL